MFVEFKIKSALECKTLPTRCDDEVSFILMLFFSLNPLDAVLHIHKRENINVEKMC